MRAPAEAHVPRPNKKALLDAIIGAVTHGQFTGDERDGVAQRISPQNFWNEGVRLVARAYREQLSRLSHRGLVSNYQTVVATHAEAWRAFHEGEARLAQEERDAKVEAFRQQQAERGRRNTLQPEILEAARHYRDRSMGGRKMTAFKAWHAIKKRPYTATTGAIVAIAVDGKNETMCVQLPDGTKKRLGIQFATWPKHYWPAAAKPTPLQPGSFFSSL
jgi:hypothetical protein